MRIAVFKLICAIVFCSNLLSNNGIAQVNDDKHVHTVMRQIGHELLLNFGDTTSRVLPIEKKGNEYKIQFDSDFEFVPEELVATIDEVLEEGRINDSYLIEVQECVTNTIVYSCEVYDRLDKNELQCRTRFQPVGCYAVLIRFIGESDKVVLVNNTASVYSGWKLVFLLLFLIVVIGGIVYFLLARRKPVKNPNLIEIGNYLFDQRNMELSFEDQKIELTSKESNLLFLLHDSANSTIEREVILKMVWGDEGDYVGRTLDVFISKLRKKLVEDSRIRIVNIRGVGYKLILDV